MACSGHRPWRQRLSNQSRAHSTPDPLDVNLLRYQRHRLASIKSNIEEQRTGSLTSLFVELITRAKLVIAAADEERIKASGAPKRLAFNRVPGPRPVHDRTGRSHRRWTIKGTRCRAWASRRRHRSRRRRLQPTSTGSPGIIVLGIQETLSGWMGRNTQSNPKPRALHQPLCGLNRQER